MKVSGSTYTTLAVDLINGATTIQLTDSTGWYEGPTGHQRNIGFYPYQNAQGYTYPDYTYTRDILFDNNGTWAENGIDHVTHTITLSSPYSGQRV